MSTPSITPPIRVLLIDDDEEDYLITRDLLARVRETRFALERAATVGPALEALQREEFDVCLLDYRLGEHNGLDLLRETQRRGCPVPIILLTGQGDHEIDVQAMQAGAADYLVKDQTNAALLERSIRHALERQRAAEALRASEELTRRVIDSSRDGIHVLSLNGRLLWMSEGGRQLLDIPDLEPVLGTSWYDFWEGTDREAAIRAVAAAGTGDTGRFQGYCATMRGRPRWWDVVVTPIMDAAGRPERLLSVARDITERRRAEEALRESEAQFRMIANEAPVLFWTMDEAGRNTFCNKGWLEFSGLTLEEALNDGWKRIIHPEDATSFLAALDAARDARRSYDIICRMRHASGAYRWISHRGTARYLPDERFAGYVGTCIDITDYVEANERLRVSQEQLHQAQKMDAVGRLAGGVAHDFNNMLGAITGYTDLLLHREWGDETREFLHEIMRAAERAANLTRQLLIFSRKEVVTPQVLDLGEIVTSMHKMLRRLIGEDIDLVTISDLEQEYVRADPGQIEQVILNLAVNARDAMPHGGRLTIQTRGVTPAEWRTRPWDDLTVPGESAGDFGDRGWVLLSMSDTGSGMDAETRSRIFEPFFTTKEAGKGTGLGLATVYGIVQQANGAIRVASNPGQGTTFEIYLPLIEGTARAAALIDAPALAFRGSETILVAEDEPIVRRMVRQVLQSRGYTVLEALQGDDALRLCEQHPNVIDLLVTDVVMPGMSGRELAERAAHLRPEMKVLFMSGYTDDHMLRHGVPSADIDFIEKPFKSESLAWKVREMLGVS